MAQEHSSRLVAGGRHLPGRDPVQKNGKTIFKQGKKQSDDVKAGWTSDIRFRPAKLRSRL